LGAHDVDIDLEVEVGVNVVMGEFAEPADAIACFCAEPIPGLAADVPPGVIVGGNENGGEFVKGGGGFVDGNRRVVGRWVTVSWNVA